MTAKILVFPTAARRKAVSRQREARRLAAEDRVKQQGIADSYRLMDTSRDRA